MTSHISPSPSTSGVLPIEIGSLSTSSPNKSQFFGSSSGVFFVNTVLRAFADSHPESTSHLSTTGDTESPAQPSVNDCIAEQGDDVDLPAENVQVFEQDHFGNSVEHPKTYGRIQHGLGRPPDIKTAEELVTTYFKLWHPIFPFLHGPAFLQELESFYTSDVNQLHQTAFQNRNDTRRAVLFQCIFNLAAIDRPDIILPPESRIESITSLMSLLGVLSLRTEIPFLQALLAAQLYLMASMSLQAASIVGGTLMRKVCHAGLHRCPHRYSQLSLHDCNIRKRIFWCVYATDRYLNHALGHPLAIQDSDVDVCVPGTRELHKPVLHDAHTTEIVRPDREILLHLPEGHPDSLQYSTRELHGLENSIPPTSELTGIHGDAFVSPRHSGEDVLASYIGYIRILGRALELFHKSIHNRSIQNGDILTLKSEVHSWWNLLPYELQDLTVTTNLPHSPSRESEISYNFAPFFTIMYQQLILTINRPFLSLNPATPEFRSSLQTCLKASRTIVSTLREYTQRRQSMSAPGILSSTWMSGLVIAFACELKAYPSNRGILEIETCLNILNTMGEQWSNARHCHAVLNILSSNLSSQLNEETDARQRPSSTPRGQSLQSHARRTRSPKSRGDWSSEKRQRIQNSEAGNSFDFLGNLTNQQGQFSNQQFNDPALDSMFHGNGVDTQGLSKINELQWPDVFGHVSWEALFQGGSEHMENTGNTL